jgi:RNA polymerase sigma-70 factor (ECF subfamily)
VSVSLGLVANGGGPASDRFGFPSAPLPAVPPGPQPIRSPGDAMLTESSRPDRMRDQQAEAAAADLELVRRAQAGDELAFGLLVERNRRAVFRAAYAALGSADDAEDVAQDTFVTVYQKLSGFRAEASFKTWLLSIAWRKALDRRRSLTRWMRLTVRQNQLSPEALDLMERLPASARTQEDGLAGDELTRTVKQLIGTLPRKLRDALLLAGSGDYSYEQIGHMQGIPLGTVKWRVAEARRLLKKKLAALGYDHG